MYSVCCSPAPGQAVSTKQQGNWDNRTQARTSLKCKISDKMHKMCNLTRHFKSSYFKLLCLLFDEESRNAIHDLLQLIVLANHLQKYTKYTMKRKHDHHLTNNVNIAFAKGGAHLPIKGQPTI